MIGSEHTLILLYIDPGSGSLLFQMLIAGFLAVVFYFKSLGRWFRSLFSRKKDLS